MSGNRAQLKPSGVLNMRERAWAAMRELRQFTLVDLGMKAGVSSCRLRDYLRGLLNAGIVRRLGVETNLAAVPMFTKIVYELVKDCGVEAPRVRKDGVLLPDGGQQRMWTAMRVLRNFNVRDLVYSASLPGHPVADSAAESYCRWLERGGYLRRDVAEAGGGLVRWHIVKLTGARAPQILRVKQLFDPNTGEICAAQPVRDALDEAERV